MNFWTKRRLIESIKMNWHAPIGRTGTVNFTDVFLDPLYYSVLVLSPIIIKVSTRDSQGDRKPYLGKPISCQIGDSVELIFEITLLSGNDNVPFPLL
jgi:hypothetical protein